VVFFTVIFFAFAGFARGFGRFCGFYGFGGRSFLFRPVDFLDIFAVGVSGAGKEFSPAPPHDFEGLAAFVANARFGQDRVVFGLQFVHKGFQLHDAADNSFGPACQHFPDFRRQRLTNLIALIALAFEVTAETAQFQQKPRAVLGKDVCGSAFSGLFPLRHRFLHMDFPIFEVLHGDIDAPQGDLVVAGLRFVGASEIAAVTPAFEDHFPRAARTVDVGGDDFRVFLLDNRREFVDVLRQFVVEFRQDPDPVLFPFGDLVEVLFHLGRKFDVHDIGKMVVQFFLDFIAQ